MTTKFPNTSQNLLSYPDARGRKTWGAASSRVSTPEPKNHRAGCSMHTHLLQLQHAVIPVLVKHQNRHLEITKLPDAAATHKQPSQHSLLSNLRALSDKSCHEEQRKGGGGLFELLQNSQLPAHPTGARGRADVRGHGNGLELAVAVGDGLGEGHALGAGADGVRGVLDVGAGDVGVAGRGEGHGADAEVAVGAVGGRFGGEGVPLEVVQLLDGEAEGGGGGFEVLRVDAGEEGGWLGRHGGGGGGGSSGGVVGELWGRGGGVCGSVVWWNTGVMQLRLS